jgi:tetratricopeptide (TPR) repeat protein
MLSRKSNFISLIIFFVAAPLIADMSAVEYYKDYKKSILEADTKVQMGFYIKALEMYEISLKQFLSIKERFPEWSSMVLVDIQVSRCEEKIEEIKILIVKAKKFRKKYAINPSIVSEVGRSAERRAFEELLRRADVLLASSEFQRALLYYDKALEYQPKDPYVQLSRGICYFKLSQVSKTIAILKILIEEYPHFASAYYNMGDVHYAIGQLNEAIPLYQKAVELDPEDLRSRINLGVIYVKLSRYNKALDEFLYVVKKNEDSVDAHYNLGVIYSDYLFDRDKAIFHYRKYLDIVPSAEDRYEVEQWLKELLISGDENEVST